jgi:hypothetical protein
MSSIHEYETELALVEKSLNDGNLTEKDTQFAKQRQALLRANISDLDGLAYMKTEYANNCGLPGRKHDMYHLHVAVHRKISEREDCSMKNALAWH